MPRISAVLGLFAEKPDDFSLIFPAEFHIDEYLCDAVAETMTMAGFLLH